MKELSIEEKARAYDEAVGVCRKLYNKAKANGYTSLSEVYEQIFPELKESEDKRIRKELIDFLEYYRLNNVLDSKTIFLLTDSVAWLEKQGNKDEEILILKDQIESLHAAIKALKEAHKIDLEKQGEQKQADKVEPKFKVGDWVVNNNGEPQLYQVTARSWPDSKIKRAKNNLELFINTATLDKQYHLWTIQDAKDGDVLGDGTTIFIFKDLLSDGLVMSYCDYDTDSGESDAFCPLSMNLMCSKITPATKEQRDTLMKAMADDGYEWDAEKKELKKIEQKPAWSEEDEHLFQIVIDILDRENHLGNISHTDLIACVRKLKSLRPQNTWKPSDEQIKALEAMLTVSPQSPVITSALLGLYEQLKKLRG